MNTAFRKLNDREILLIEKLLECEFPGRNELLEQVVFLEAQEIIGDGTLRLRCKAGPPSLGIHGLVAEGFTNDADGGKITILLHVGVNGYLWMLEILRMDTSPIINPPTAEDFVRVLPKKEQ